MLEQNLLEQLEQWKIIAIMRGITGEQADRTIAALAEGGVRFVEATMNTKDATGMIAKWRETYDGRLWIGAGTVLDAEMAKEAVAAGAQFLVCPNTDPEVIAYAREAQIGVFPGALTPTEIVQAWKLGATAVKLFPSKSLGIDYFREVRAPLDRIRLIPTGGISLANIEDFLKAGAFAFGIGGGLADKAAIAAGRFDAIRDAAAAYAEKVRQYESAPRD